MGYRNQNKNKKQEKMLQPSKVRRFLRERL